ncbi:MAG: hypothetical protein C4291_14920 [Candidatus Dadabacteria bacterium]
MLTRWRLLVVGIALLTLMALAIAIPTWARSAVNSDWPPFTMIYRQGGNSPVGELSSVHKLIWRSKWDWRDEVLEHVVPGSAAPGFISGDSVGSYVEFKNHYLTTYNSQGQQINSSRIEGPNGDLNVSTVPVRWIIPHFLETAKSEGLREVPTSEPNRIKLMQVVSRTCGKDPFGKEDPTCNPNDRVTTEMVFTKDRGMALSRTVKLDNQVIEYFEVLDFKWGSP